MLSTVTSTTKCIEYSLLLMNIKLPGAVTDRKGAVTKTKFLLLHVGSTKIPSKFIVEGI